MNNQNLRIITEYDNPPVELKKFMEHVYKELSEASKRYDNILVKIEPIKNSNIDDTNNFIELSEHVMPSLINLRSRYIKIKNELNNILVDTDQLNVQYYLETRIKSLIANIIDITSKIDEYIVSFKKKLQY